MDERPESLHTHSALSDGKNTHQEMFEAGQKLGLSVMAFTDHDALPNDEQLAYLDSVRSSRMKWIIGTEITASLPHDLAETKGTLHIVGLFVDPRNESLLEHSRRSQEDRTGRIVSMVRHLQGLGFDITETECFEIAGEGSAGRPHIVRILRGKPHNISLIERYRTEMERDAKRDPNLKNKYDRMIALGQEGYPYVLFLHEDAYKTGIYSEHGYMPSFDHAVEMVRDAGGVAILAHYFVVSNKISLDVLHTLLSEKRIDGVETVYRAKPYQPKEFPDIKEERMALRRLAFETGTLMTGGPDAHDIDDIQSFLEARDLAEETVGMTEKLIASGKADTHWSSF